MWSYSNNFCTLKGSYRWGLQCGEDPKDTRSPPSSSQLDSSQRTDLGCLNPDGKLTQRRSRDYCAITPGTASSCPAMFCECWARSGHMYRATLAVADVEMWLSMAGCCLPSLDASACSYLVVAQCAPYVLPLSLTATAAHIASYTMQPNTTVVKEAATTLSSQAATKARGNPNSCAKACTENRACKAFTYNVTTRVCQLFRCLKPSSRKAAAFVFTGTRRGSNATSLACK
jgi:hypothetical protein